MSSSSQDHQVVNSDEGILSTSSKVVPIFDENGKPKVYKQRFLVLGSYMLSYFLWSWWGNKTSILAPSFAKYHNVTNEFDPETFTGVDFIPQFASIIVIISYPFAAYAIDKYGLNAMIFGNFFLAISCWVWYAAMENFGIVILARAIGGLFGPMVSGAILAVSNRWFPESERAQATAAGSVIGLLGAGAAVVAGPFFFGPEPRVVDLSLKSCRPDRLSETVINAYNDAIEQGTSLPDCTTDGDSSKEINEAFENFCCYREADIPAYNLYMAIAQTLAFFFSIAVVRNNPPTPPSTGGEKKEHEATYASFKRLLKTKQIRWITITDILVTGPPMVLFSSVARILPAEVAAYDLIMSASGIALAIPASAIFSRLLDRKKKYYEYTFWGYASATFLWLIATIGFMVGGIGGGVLVIICGCCAVVAFVVWQVSEYELKLEWGYDDRYAAEGAVSSLDRITINTSSFLFTLAIPPERFPTGAIGTFWVGFVLLLLGTLWFMTTPDKFHYRRKEHEDSHLQNAKRRLSATLVAPAGF